MSQRSSENTKLYVVLALIFAIVTAAFVHGVRDLLQKNAPIPNTAEAAVVVDSAESDSAHYAKLVSKIAYEMPWLDSLQNNRPKLCLKVVDYFEVLEHNVDNNIRLFNARDTTVNRDVSLYLASAEFLRHHCYDVFAKQKMGDGVWLFAYERAARLMYVLETASR
jgi:hypothetical protein